MSVSVVNRGSGGGKGVEINTSNGSVTISNAGLISGSDVGDFVTVDFDIFETGEYFNNIIPYGVDTYGQNYIGVKRNGTRNASIVLFQLTNSNTFKSLATASIDKTILDEHDTDSSGLMYFYATIQELTQDRVLVVCRNGAQMFEVVTSGSTVTLTSKAVQTWTAFGRMSMGYCSFPALIYSSASTSTINRLAFIYSYYTKSGSSYVHTLAMVPIIAKPGSNAIIVQDPVIFKTVTTNGTLSPFRFVTGDSGENQYIITYDGTESGLYKIDITYPATNTLALSYSKVKSFPNTFISPTYIRTRFQFMYNMSGKPIYYIPSGEYSTNNRNNKVGFMFSVDSSTENDKLITLGNQKMEISSSVGYDIAASSCALHGLGFVYSDIKLITTYIKYSYYYIFGYDGNTKIVNDNSPYKLRNSMSAFSMTSSYNSSMLLESRTNTYKLGDYSTGNHYLMIQIPRFTTANGKQVVGIKTADNEITLD
ncbi:MAG: hypothetical protein HFE73_10235 [Firmicutes bacterium]|nr:hypothetical protein [Bacillota bacterium]